MPLRPPRAFSNSTPAIPALDYEIAQEQASALGRLGRKLEAALAALSDHERMYGRRGAGRGRLVAAASEALWCFVIQREACGLRDTRSAIGAYRVPAEVRNAMGAFGKNASAD